MSTAETDLREQRQQASHDALGLGTRVRFARTFTPQDVQRFARAEAVFTSPAGEGRRGKTRSSLFGGQRRNY